MIGIPGKASVTFQSIESPNGKGELSLTALSRDGRTAVGSLGRSYYDRRPVVWNQSSGLNVLGTFGGRSGTATGISGDGRFVVGIADTTRTEKWMSFPLGPMDHVVTRPFLWDGRRFVDLADLTDARFRKSVEPRSFTSISISADGRTIACGVGGRVADGFLWKPDRGLTPLGSIAGRNDYTPGGMAADGSVIVGNCAGWYSDIPSGSDFFIWTAQKGLRRLATREVAPDCPACVSGDGRTVVWGGDAYSDRRKQWESGARILNVSTGVVRSLGPAPSNHTYQAVRGVSHDGTIIVGDYFDGKARDYYRPFLWTAKSNHARGLYAVLAANTALGPLWRGWSLGSVSALSSDGTTIIGAGTDPNGKDKVWRVVISSGIGNL